MNADMTPGELRDAAVRMRAANPRSPLPGWLEDEAARMEAEIARWSALASKPLGRKGAAIAVSIHNEATK